MSLYLLQRPVTIPSSYRNDDELLSDQATKLARLVQRLNLDLRSKHGKPPFNRGGAKEEQDCEDLARGLRGFCPIDRSVSSTISLGE